MKATEVALVKHFARNGRALMSVRLVSDDTIEGVMTDFEKDGRAALGQAKTEARDLLVENGYIAS